ncbi:MAG: hypothetical protein IPM54_32680 [Polyangiaceae bacterium]|nr:hypothetical protein [Polyangiaceae bacterium]
MTTDAFDPSPYTSAPRMTLESGIVLARALVTACPQSMPARVHKAAQKLAGSTDKAQAKLALRQKALGSVSEEDKRVVDQAGDGSWGALRSRLSSYAMLPAAEYPDAKRAGELTTILFNDQGLSFLTESYPVQWATADTILKRIDDDGLQTDIDRIAGPEFLDNIRKRHAKYGAMVQSILIKADQAHVDLGAEVRALGSAIVAYATKVCAHVEDDDAKTIAEARAALQPIDLHREATSKRSTTTPETPSPETPAAP